MRPLVMWWLALSALGWLTWPLVASLFRQTPGRGYAYARAFGLLLLSYSYWILGTLGVLSNNTVSLWGLAGVWAIVGTICWIYKRDELIEFVRRKWRHILTVELLFLILFILYATHKSYDPAIEHTEEPMDFALLNGILHSARLPPNDPWLSGFSISYYYLGYLTVAVLARLTGLPSGIGYNLGLTHTLALTVVGGYGLIYDLICWQNGPRATDSTRIARVFGILGGVAIGIAGNLEGICELLRAGGLLPGAFLRWLDIPGLADALPTGSWLPGGGWWWWRASRIIRDHNILGKIPTVITEFPIFSFILGDLHPHVMSLPYALMALGLACELYGLGRSKQVFKRWPLSLYWMAPLIFGALGFLNSWDLPIFLALGILAFCVERWHARFAGRAWVQQGILFGLWLTLCSVLLYVPFYLELRSQVQGIGLVYYAKTPLRHYVLCFGLWLLPILADVFVGSWGLRTKEKSGGGGSVFWAVWGGLLFLPWLVTMLLGSWGRTLLGLGTLVMVGPWLLLLQSGILAILLTDLWNAFRTNQAGRDSGRLFSRLLVLVGVGLTYATEFFYVRDAFDTRMNTIFKSYYQAWLLLGIGAVCASYRLWRDGGWRRVFSCFSGLLLCACLYYPVAAAYTKSGAYRGEPTLDGTAFLREESPAEYGAYLWLREHAQPEDVVVEAPGEEFVASTNRLSSWTGVPTILGWAGHEAQWRGDDAEVLRRIPDVERIYTSSDEQQVLAALQQYEATYLYVGPYERKKYALLDDNRLEWYATFLEMRYAEGDVRLYKAPRY